MPGAQAWQAQLAPLGAVNFGIMGDQTQQLLWRALHGELAGLPRVAVVMIGVNNFLRGQPPAEAAAGIKAVIDAIRRTSPGTTVLLLGVLPAAPVPMPEIAQVNALLAGLNNGTTVRFLDLGGLFLRPDGTLNAGLLDVLGVHPNALGYQALTNVLLGPLEALLG